MSTYPIVTLAEARDAACRVRDMQLGNYGNNEPKEKVLTLGNVIADFIEIYVKPKRMRERRSWSKLRTSLGQ